MTDKTLLYDEHVKLGARIVEFAGWEMPVQYCSIVEEHNCVRNNVGIFDVSHMGEFFVSGKDSLAFLNKLVPQDISKLYDTKAVYCQLLNENAGLVDDLIIYKLADEKYFIILNASRIQADYDWFKKNSKGYDVLIENKSIDYSLLAVQGPKASDLIEKLGVKKENQPKFFSIIDTNIKGMDVSLSRTGYTGEDGFEILLKNQDAVKMWQIVLKEGQEFGIKPIGLGARDTLRLEAALHLYGNDLNAETTPIEAGLKWSVSKDKVDDYNGKPVIQKQLKDGVSKRLIGLVMMDKSIARHEYEVFYKNEMVGKVTSGGISPTLGQNIALAYVNNIEEICIDSVLQVKIREKFHDAKVVKLPFVKKNNKI